MQELILFYTVIHSLLYTWSTCCSTIFNIYFRCKAWWSHNFLQELWIQCTTAILLLTPALKHCFSTFHIFFTLYSSLFYSEVYPHVCVWHVSTVLHSDLILIYLLFILHSILRLYQIFYPLWLFFSDKVILVLSRIKKKIIIIIIIWCSLISYGAFCTSLILSTTFTLTN